MRKAAAFAGVFFAVVCAAGPAFANPGRPSLLTFQFLPSVIALMVVYNVLSRCAGNDEVLDKLYEGRKRPNNVNDAIVVIVVSFFISPIGYLAVALWSLFWGARMFAWGVVPLVYSDPPEHLAPVRPARMLLCALGLMCAVPVSGYVSVVFAPHPGWIERGPMAKAVSEVRNADLALWKMLDDAQCKKPSDLFVDPEALYKPTIAETIEHHTKLANELLHKGRNADIGLKPEVAQKLGESYMDIGLDPWKKAHQFYFGPLKCRVNEVPFRSYRGEKYVYDKAAYEELNKKLRGNPVPDDDIPATRGFPAPRDLPVYIFSYGDNKKPDQLPWNGDGYDDINNWDNESGWGEFY